MTRLQFAAAVLLLAAPAAAKPVPAPAVADIDAQYRDAAARLFPDKADQAVFLYRIAHDPVLAADVVTAVKKAQAAGGDDAAVNARLSALPAANGWKKDVGLDITKTRAVLDAGVNQPAPRTDYADTPLVGALMTGLGKKTPAEVFAVINTPENGGPVPRPCAPGASTAFGQLKAAVADGAAAFNDGPCVGDTPPKTLPAKDAPVKAAPALTASAPLKTDLQTNAPPAPGSDKGASGKKGGLLSGLSGMFTAQSLGTAAVFGGMGALFGSIGGPAGMIIGGLIGALAGLFLVKASGAKDG